MDEEWRLWATWREMEWEKEKWWSGRYYSQVFYKANPLNTEWKMICVIVKDIPQYKMFFESAFSDYLKDAPRIVELEENATYIQLENKSISMNSWEIDCVDYCIDRKKLDDFSLQHSIILLSVPHFYVKFRWPSALPPRQAKMKFHLVGVERPNHFFHVFLPRDSSQDSLEIHDKETFTFIAHKNNTFQSQKCALRIEVPEGSLPAGETAELQANSVIDGDITFPPDLHQVSGIYQLNCSQELKKEATLRLGHHAVIDADEECGDYSVYSADTSSKPPYMLEKEDEGSSFSISNMFASIKLRSLHSKIVTIFCRRRPRQRYCSQVFFSSASIREIEMMFVITKDDATCKQFLRESFDRYEKYVDQCVTLKKEATSIELKPCNATQHPWTMTPRKSYEITRDQIDNFNPLKSCGYPNCHFDFICSEDPPISCLSIRIDMIGAEHPNDFFNLLLPPRNTPQDLQSLPSEVDDTPLTVDDLAIVMESTHTVTDWCNFGLVLKVPIAELERIEYDYSRTLDRQRKALECSLKTGCTSWASIVQALKSPLINMHGLANDIARNHPKQRRRCIIL